MTIEDLRAQMRKGFKSVDDRFKTVDDRFKRIDDRFDRIDDQFKRVGDRFNAVDAELQKLRAEMKAEGERTRRHFDVMVERMQESVKIVAEATAHHAVRLDGHEKRIKRLEGPRRA